MFGLLFLAACGSPQKGGTRDPLPDSGATDGSSANVDGGKLDGMTQLATTCAETKCNTHASCSDMDGDAVCNCDSGFEKKGDKCVDIDECADAKLNDCGAHASCENAPGGYACACDSGFADDGKMVCKDVDECATGDKVCDINAGCTNTTGGAKCKCNPGYSGDGSTCTDIDECSGASPKICQTHASCQNTPGSAYCKCDAGYHLNTGTDACDPNTACPNGTECDTNATCDGTTHVCQCNDGYDGDGGAGHCAPVNECNSGMNDCSPQADCTDETPGFTCKCRPGFSGDGKTCTDINECKKGTDNCKGTATCRNIPGGFVCDCPDGYTGDGSGGCKNLNECGAPSLNDCNDNADCTDKTPGYECKCKTGFTGDGTTHCDDIDECANSTLNDCTGGETCMNNAGGYICGCNAPYVKNGANCYCDLTGMWGMRQDVNTTYPHVLGPGGFEVIMAGSLHTTVWELHQMTYDGTTVKVKKKGCGPLQTPDLIGSGILAGETYGTYIPQSVWNAFPLFTGVDVPLVNAKPGSAFVSPKEAVALGIKLNNPLTDAWPSLANAVHDDAEGDGVDGLMIWAHTPSETTHAGGSHKYSYPYISTNRAVCVTTATRVINHLDGTVVDCKKITGDVKRDLVPGQQPGDKPIAEQHTYDCRRPVSASTSYGCTKADWDNTSKMTACSQSEINGLDAQVDQTTTTATFELVKLSDDPNDASVDCNMVRSKLPAYP